MLGENLKKARQEKGYTQDDLAHHLKIKRQTYSAYERGVSVPDAITLKEISAFLGVSTDYLLGSDKPKLDDIAFALYGEVKDLDEETKKDILNFAKYMRQKRASEKKDKKDS